MNTDQAEYQKNDVVLEYDVWTLRLQDQTLFLKQDNKCLCFNYSTC